MKLSKNGLDSNYLFRRDDWKKDIYITWSNRYNEYKFVSITKKEIYECRQQGNLLAAVYSRLRGTYNIGGLNSEFLYYNIINSANNLDIETIADIKKNKTIKENNMSKSLNLVGNFEVVDVEFGFNHEIKEERDGYTYKIDPSLHENIKLGQVVIVNNHDIKYKVARVCRVYEAGISSVTIRAKNSASAWVVNIVDVSEHEKREENTERRSFILAELERKKSEIQEMEVLKLLASQDSEAAKLIAELNSIEGKIIDAEVE